MDRIRPAFLCSLSLLRVQDIDDLVRGATPIQARPIVRVHAEDGRRRQIRNRCAGCPGASWCWGWRCESGCEFCSLFAVFFPTQILFWMAGTGRHHERRTYSCTCLCGVGICWVSKHVKILETFPSTTAFGLHSERRCPRGCSRVPGSPG